jgi:uncharacterized repeat protein (TIGR01451 family)
VTGMVGLGRVRRLLVLFGVVFVVLPAGSALASTIGQVGASSGVNGQCGTGVFADTSYVVPAGGGVINSFSVNSSAASAGDQRDFLVLRGSGGNYTVVGKTGLVTLLGSGTQSFPANIAVQSGDILGFFVAGGDFAFHQECERVVSGGGGFISGTTCSPVPCTQSDPSVGETLPPFRFPTPDPTEDLNESANLVLNPPSIAEAFSSSQVPLDEDEALTFTITNPNAAALTGVAFTDTLPSGLIIPEPGITGIGACDGGTLTAVAGSDSISLTGGSIPATGVCTIAVNVLGGTAGDKNNSVTVSSDNGGTGNTANATLTVVGPPSIAEAFGAPTVPLNGTTSLTFTITNPSANTAELDGVAFTDTLPSGLVVATPNGLSNTCGGEGATATAGSGSISLSGGSIAASSSCEVVVNVTGTTAGDWSNSTTVSSTNGGTGNTASANLTVAPPTVTAVSPVGGPTAGGNTVTVTGANFAAGATVRFGSAGSALPSTFVSSSKLTVTAPAHAAGAVNVFVTTGLGTSAATSSDLYTFRAPVVSGVSPRGGSTAGGNTVTITGANFAAGATVRFGGSGSALPSTFVSSSKLTVTAPAHAAGAVNVLVTTGPATSAATNSDLYAFGAPVVSGVSPTGGPTGGGTVVTITGRDFVSGATVKFGAQSTLAPTFVSPSKLTVAAPAQAAGTVNVSVSTAAGTSASTTADQYTYCSPCRVGR